VGENLLVQLVRVFAPLSFLSVGGGQSIISGIHGQVVSVHHWMSNVQFLNLFALSRMAPGPGTLLVTLIGWQVGGWAGAILASAAIFIPSSLLVYLLAKLWEKQRGAPWQRAVEVGLAPIAAGMILASSFILLRPAEGGPLAWIVALGSCVLLLWTKISPFLLMAAGAIVFLLLRH
jgi:chromate transporter